MSMSLKRSAPKTFTPAERVAIVSEIQARLKHGAKLDELAPEFGIASTTYFTWLRRGVRPEAMPAKRRPMPEELRAKSARRYDEEQRREILAQIARRTAAGEFMKHVLADLDLGRTTYQRWLELQAPGAEPAFRAVAVVPDARALAVVHAPSAPAPAAPLTLVSPGGYRLEGLDAASAAALLRALP